MITDNVSHFGDAKKRVQNRPPDIIQYSVVCFPSSAGENRDTESFSNNPGDPPGQNRSSVFTIFTSFPVMQNIP